jgi:glycosyltransferase involved in cell wall biosynthesis
MHLEQLEQGRELPFDQWSRRVAEATEVLNDQLERGDFFLCASERQRMFWLGQLAALGRLNPATYRDDPDFDGLISVVPFGLSATPPEHSRAVLKGVLPGVGQHDKLVIWSGGLYNWFDPLTLIRAVSQLASTHPDLRLFFQGTKHPHPGVPEMEIVARSRALAEELGVLDRVVFFNESWVDYDDRQNYLLEADAGASTHFTHIETTFSFRTRILDYLWAGLPMVVTGGDVFAELIRDEELGVVVAPGDVDALARALEVVVYDTARASVIRENIDRVRLDFVWEKSLAPLMAFIADPHHAGDFLTRRRTRGRRRTGFRHDLGRVFSHLREEGPSAVVSRVAARVRGR